MTKDELQKFCADSRNFRHELRAPFSRANWTFATNGHIMLCVPRIVEISENAAAPDCVALLSKIPNAENWLAVPECKEPVSLECDECDGTGRAECPTCRHEDDCDNCDGTGKIRQRIAVAVGDAHFDQRYLAMIRGYEIATNGPNVAARIRKGEISGVLMPMRAQ